MYNASNAFHEAVAAEKPQRVLMEFGDTIFTNEDISVSSGVHLVEPFNPDTDFKMGCCPSATLDFTLLNERGQLTSFEFGTFKAQIGVRIASVASESSFVGAVCRLDVWSGYSSVPYLRVNGQASSVQPDYPVCALVRDESTLYVIGENGRVCRGEIINDNVTVLTAVNVSPFMRAKLSRWQGRGLRRVGRIVTEWVDGRCDTWEYVPLGTFVGTRPNVVQKTEIAVEAEDQMVLFDVDVPSVAFPITIKELLNTLCAHVGVTYNGADFINGDEIISAEPDEFSTATCRDVLEWIAEAGCSYARFNRDGVLEMAWFTPTEQRFDESTYTTYAPYWYETPAIQSMTVRNYNSNAEEVLGDATNSGHGYLIQNNPLLRIDDSASVRTMSADNPRDRIFNRLQTAPSFHPASTETFGDWATQAGDIVSVSSNGETHQMPVYTMDMTWNGAPMTTLDSSGNQTREPIPKSERSSYSNSHGGYRRTKKGEEEMYTRIDQTDEHILLEAVARSEADGDLHGQILVQAGRIDLTASKTEVTELGERVSQAEINIDGANAKINLKASKTEVDELGNRVSSAEIAIDGANAQIDLKVDKDGVVSAINVSPEGVTIDAKKINLNGYVTASQLDAVSAKIENLKTGTTRASKINAAAVSTGTLSIGGLDGRWLYLQDGAGSYHWYFVQK